MKRNLIVLFSIFAALMLVIGCSQEDTSTSNTTDDNTSNTDETETTNDEQTEEVEEIELTLWFGREDFIPDDAFEQFEAENPNIKITTDVIPLENATEEFIRASKADNQPDIVQVPSDRTKILAEQQLLLDMTDHLAQWKQENSDSYDAMVPLAWDMASNEGTPYGVTVHAGPFWYVYNKNLFEEAGYSEAPKTWDEVLEIGEAISDGENIGFSVIGSRAHDPVWFLSTFMSMGGQFEDGVPQLNSDAGEYILNFYQQLAGKDITDKNAIAWEADNMRAAFITGEAGQAMIGDNIFPTIQEAMSYNEDWGASPPPVRPGGESDAAYMALGWPYLVSNKTEHPEAVLKALQYLSSTEIVKDVALRYQPTTNVEVLSHPEYLEAKPWAADFEEAFAQLVELPSHERQSNIYEVLLDAMQEAIQNPDSDAKEMAEKYQEQIDQIVQ
ncbi:ABC transporter substrate-binding protein [Aquibacillus halophilus]|nr:extracellular solute-binding protein [Aquibacillus halophilus]